MDLQRACSLGAGTLAGIAGALAGPTDPRAFCAYWVVVAVMVIAVDLLLVRRQARLRKEPMWSPPARRIAWALTPAFVAGCGLAALAGEAAPASAAPWVMLVVWTAFYGCGVHAASFFLPREVGRLGWLCLVASVAWGSAAALWARPAPPAWAHAAMGATFGGLHLFYGAYLVLAAKKRSGNAA